MNDTRPDRESLYTHDTPKPAAAAITDAIDLLKESFNPGSNRSAISCVHAALNRLEAAAIQRGDGQTKAKPSCKCGQPAGPTGLCDDCFLGRIGPSLSAPPAEMLRAKPNETSGATLSDVFYQWAERDGSINLQAYQAEIFLRELNAVRKSAGAEGKPERMFPIMGVRGHHAISEIPWSLIAPFDKQAQHNHGGQTLERLAQRGGLSPDEAVAVMEGRPWSNMPYELAVARLRELTAAKSTPGVEAAEIRGYRRAKDEARNRYFEDGLQSFTKWLDEPAKPDADGASGGREGV